MSARHHRNFYNFYTDLVNNPFAAKPYRDLADYYREIGKKNDSDAFLLALEAKFENNSKHSSTKQ